MSGTKIVINNGEQRLIAKADSNDRYVEVVPGGERTYLWIGNDAEPCLLTISGARTLSKLAHYILRELGEEVQS